MAKIEVYEMLRLCMDLVGHCPRAVDLVVLTVSDEASEIPADDAVPRCSCSRVELLDALLLAFYHL